MGHQINFKCNIGPIWDTVSEIRDRVGTLLENTTRDFIDSCRMTASELIENAVKYGSSVHKNAGIEFELIMEGKIICIRVTNKVMYIDDYENVKTHINKINAADNPKDLYVKRLMLLMENPDIKRTQLGLYRIAYEGNFNLSYDYQNQILTVMAKKKI